MSRPGPGLLVRSAPFLRRGVSTPGLMMDVLIALGAVMLAAVWFFGLSAILVVAATTAGALAAELWLAPGGPRGSSLKDGSAALTGILLGLTLPPGFPLWMALLGGGVAIGLGKAAFGGLGQNLFNPALVGRAFLQAAFPTAITTWSAQGTLADFGGVRGANLALPLMQGAADGTSATTPLGMMKFESEGTPLWSLLIGDSAGSLGETSAGLIILCGILLALRRTFDWRIPVSIVLSAALFSGFLHGVMPGHCPGAPFMLLSGGLLFGAVFMATDPVTSPLAPAGAWIFGAGIGVLVVLIRAFGGLPEGVMYAILLMNAATPLIERAFQPRPLGRTRSGKAVA
ncbi:MAG: RnfABCDGE type electron transport complex subunit D [Planctomycetota bacterium]